MDGMRVEQYYKSHRRHSLWKRVVSALAAIVVFCTTYALILPAITLENVVCGMEAHTHEASCYTAAPEATRLKLVCTADSLGIHAHSDTCYDGSGQLLCGLADFVLHQHGDACYDELGKVVCDLPQMAAHRHDDSCWQQPHVHGEACHTLQQGELLCQVAEGTIHQHGDGCYAMEEKLICTQPEILAHTHGDGCYTETATPICTLEEAAGHTHETACYDEAGGLLCTLEETAGHAHGEGCFSVERTLTCTIEETAGHTHGGTCYWLEPVLTCTEPADVAHVHGAACYAQNLVLTCTQLTAEQGAQPQLICREEELFAHAHSDGCYTDGALTCGLLQVPEHAHDERCSVLEAYQPTQQVLVCEKPVHTHDATCTPVEDAGLLQPGTPAQPERQNCPLAAHTHVDLCYSGDTLICTMTEHEHTLRCDLPEKDPTDCETADIWEQGLPALTGDLAADLIALAESQLGYVQSAVNYDIRGDQALFYSRYSDWWGDDPYAPWNAAFVSFCLHYAGIDFPQSRDADLWLEDLNRNDYLTEDPIPADMAFLEDGRVVIVTAVTDSGFTAIGEEDGKVRRATYGLAEPLAYARIPGNEPAADPAVLATDELLAALPAARDIRAQQAEYEASGDTEGLCLWREALSQQLTEAHDAVQALSQMQQAKLTQLDRLDAAQSAFDAVALAVEQQLQIEDLIFLIDMLPVIDEIEHRFDTLAAAGDASGLSAYRQKILSQVKACFDLKAQMNDAQLAVVTNLERLDSYVHLLDIDPNAPIVAMESLSDDWSVSATVLAQWDVPAGARFVIQPMTNAHSLDYSDTLFQVAEFTESMGVDLLEMVVQDLHFVDEYGNKITPDGSTTVTLNFSEPILSEADERYGVMVLHIADDGEVENVTGVVVRDEAGVHSVTFTTSGFSPMIIAEVSAKATAKVTTINQFNWETDTKGSWLLRNTAGIKVSDALSSTDNSSLAWNKVVVVEPNSNGQYVVKSVHPGASGSNKRNISATGQGFLLIIHSNGSLNVDVGDIAVPSSTFWQTNNKKPYSSNGYGTINFYNPTVAEAYPKEPHNNNVPTVKDAADTFDLIKVNLYDYGTNINTYWSKDHNQPGFQYPGGSTLKQTSASFGRWNMAFGDNIVADAPDGKEITVTKDPPDGVVNGTGTNFINGAIKRNLSSDKYPVLKYQNSKLDWLFSQNTYATKMNDKNINGLFRYDEESGAYTYDSRSNHAQFDASTDTFTLYDKWLTSNYVTYPFGNFLPFNDIKTQASYVPDIDRQWFLDIAAYAQYKYNQNPTAADAGRYSQLASAMRGTVNIMDKDKGNQDWTGADVMAAYFNVEKIPPGKALEALPNIYCIDYDEVTDFFFGMDMNMNFIMPKNGMTGKDHNEDGLGDYPMKFEFIGDDDVWVYIDGMLFLDLTGIHRHRGGTIDFVNGTIEYYDLDKEIGDINPDKPLTLDDGRPLTFEAAIRAALQEQGKTSAEIEAYLETTLDKNAAGKYTTFKKFTTHSFNFFYMERGSGSSVCKMNFNLPVLRDNVMYIDKDLDLTNVALAEGETLLGNPDFWFQVVDEKNTTKPLGSVDGLVEKAYYKVDPETRERLTPDDEPLYVQSDGTFSIKAGEMVEFAIQENAHFRIRELLYKTLVDGSYDITIDGDYVTDEYKPEENTNESGNFVGYLTPVMDGDHKTLSFRYTNTVQQDAVSNLFIAKERPKLAVNTQFLDNYRMYVTLDGEPLPVGTIYTVYRSDGAAFEDATMEKNRPVTDEGYIFIKAGETAKIPNVLAGTKFRITEESASALGYNVRYKIAAGALAEDARLPLKTQGETDTGFPGMDRQNGTAESTGFISGVVGSRANTVTVTVENSTEKDYVSLLFHKILLVPGGNSDGKLPFEFTLELWNSDETPYVDQENLGIQAYLYPQGQHNMDQDTPMLLVPEYESEGVPTNKYRFTLTHDEIMQVVNLPSGIRWRITEDTTDGYAVSTVYQSTNHSTDVQGNGPTVSGETTHGVDMVTFTNVSGYQLPSTGGVGTTAFVPLGLSISAGALALLALVKKRPASAGEGRMQGD